MERGGTTRERIIVAAGELMQEGGTRISVRAVAARAGIGASTLRHHFRTQQELFNTVLTRVYEQAMPDDRIHDRAVPAAARLLECLQHLLSPIGWGDAAREVWGHIFTTFIGPGVTDGVRLGYLRIAEEPQRRVESWLAILEAEGALSTGDNRRRAWFLLTVIDGLSIQRALPTSDATPEIESAVLRDAVAAVLGAPGVDRQAVVAPANVE